MFAEYDHFFTVFTFVARVPYPNPTLFVSVPIPLVQDGTVPSTVLVVR